MNKIHIVAERHLVDVLARMIVRRGYTVCVDSGGDEYDLEKSTDPAAIVEAVYAVDSCKLAIRPSNEHTIVGIILLVPGNSPEEVVADYSDKVPVSLIVDC